MALLRSYSNASSGMGVADHCRDTFLELQRKKTHRYVIFKIDEKRKEVVVEKTGGVAESYDDFLSCLPENDCRYAVYDFDFVTPENCQKSKIFFIAWMKARARRQGVACRRLAHRGMLALTAWYGASARNGTVDRHRC